MLNLTYRILEASVKQNLKKKKAVLFFGSAMYISLNMDKKQANDYFNQPARRIPCTKYSL